ncbi:MAG: hypothetical protein AAGA56_14665 [Myxococcota bacterium]
MMHHRIVLLHADPGVAPKYKDALARCMPDGHTFEFRIANSRVPGLSAAYTSLWQTDGRRVVVGDGNYDTLTVASFSAGYGYVREMLRQEPDLADCIVSLDSWHAGLDGDGTAKDSQLGGLVQFALKARRGEKVLALAHTDVPTYGYASTTQVAEELRRLTSFREQRMLSVAPQDASGLAVADAKALDRVSVDGQFLIASVDVVDEDEVGWQGYQREHSLALVGWGPAFLAASVAELAKLPRPSPPQLETSREPIGLTALAIGITKLGLHEAKQLKAVELFHAGAMRLVKGEEVNIGRWLRARDAWCASFASWCLSMTKAPKEVWPHGYRCAVRELWEDALRLGTARGISKVRRGEYIPMPGDLLIMSRGGPATGEGLYAFAKSRGLGHVGRVEGYTHGLPFIDTVDGNKSDMVKRMKYRLTDSRLIGIISYPDGERLQTWCPDDDELEGMLQLVEEAYLATGRAA